MIRVDRAGVETKTVWGMCVFLGLLCLGFVAAFAALVWATS
jgi:hypothetical protein